MNFEVPSARVFRSELKYLFISALREGRKDGSERVRRPLGDLRDNRGSDIHTGILYPKHCEVRGMHDART